MLAVGILLHQLDAARVLRDQRRQAFNFLTDVVASLTLVAGARQCGDHCEGF
jgi:hypothetical protein